MEMKVAVYLLAGCATLTTNDKKIFLNRQTKNDRSVIYFYNAILETAVCYSPKNLRPNFGTDPRNGSPGYFEQPKSRFDGR